MLTTTTHESEPSDGTMCTQEGPGGAGLTRATAPASLRCPRCDEEMPDTDQLLAHPLSSGSRSSRPERLAGHNGVPVDGREPVASVDEAVGSSRTEVEQLAVASARAVIGLEARMRKLEGVTFRKLLRDIRRFFGVRREPQCPEKREDPGDHPGHRGGHTRSRTRCCGAHARSSTSTRETGADCSDAERPGEHGVDGTTHSGDGERREECPISEGPTSRHLVKLLKDMGHWEERISDRTLNHDADTSYGLGCLVVLNK